MKLTKARLKEIFNQMIGFGNYCEKYVVSLQGHIEALEQELESTEGLLAAFYNTTRGEVFKLNTELQQENLQRLEEVKGLQSKIESLTEYSNKTAKHLRKVREDLSKAWTSNNAEREARLLLEATLEQAMLDHQPVELPKKQVDAVNFFKNPPKGIYTNWGNDTIIDCVLHHGTYADDYGLPLTALREISFDILLKALVNGCTVEEIKTPEDKVLNYYNTITPKDWKYAGDGNDPVYIERNAIRTTCYLLGKIIDGVNGVN